MAEVNQECIQLLNTAIIKTKENTLDKSYEVRLSEACSHPAMNSLAMAIQHHSENARITPDQAAVEIVELLRELDSVWNDYVIMEGLSKLKDLLGSGNSSSKEDSQFQ